MQKECKKTNQDAHDNAEHTVTVAPHQPEKEREKLSR
jgi:hypothetical protein